METFETPNFFDFFSFDDDINDQLNIHDYSNSNRSLHLNQNKNRLLVVEPYTLSWAALKLSEGALSALGGEMFKNLFRLGVDLSTLQREMLVNINIIIRKAIHDNEIRQCTARIEALTISMEYYFNSQATSLDRLLDASSESIRLTSECKSLGFNAILPFCNAVCLQIAIMQERYLKFNEKGELKNIISLCKTSFDYVFDVGFPEFMRWNEARFTKIWGPSPEFNGYYYKLDGEVCWTFTYDLPKAEKIRLKHISRESLSKHDQLYGTSWEVALNWKKLKEKLEMEI